MVGVVVSRIFSALAWKFWPTGEVSKSSLRAFGPLDLPVEIFLAMLQRNFGDLLGARKVDRSCLIL